MKFILNADDFGISQDTVEKTIELFEKEHLTSATLILNMPGTQKAIEYALTKPQFSFGLHLNFLTDTFEKPILDKKLLPSLTNSKGFFHNSQFLRKSLLLGRINLNEIGKEALAQIDYLKSSGIKISHLDSHGHIHKFPSVTKKLSTLRDEICISKMRYTQNIYIENFLRKIKRPSYWLKNYFGRNIKKEFKTTDFFFNNRNYKDTTWPQKICEFKSNHIIEIGTHPGNFEEWRRNESFNIENLSNLINRSKFHSKINWNDI